MKDKEIRVISTTESFQMEQEDFCYIKEMLVGYNITFGKKLNKANISNEKLSVEDKKADLEEAFKDENVEVIMIAKGGFCTNQLLDVIDYSIIQKSPKIIVGFSDATSLLNAIYTKTGMTTYYGPNFSVLAMRKGNEYTYDYLNKIFQKQKTYSINPAHYWSSDKWYKDQINRELIKNEGMSIIREGIAEGKIIGGNLNSFCLLQGTTYMPNVDDIILFIEEDHWAKEDYAYEFDRRLQSITQQPFFQNVRGIVIGRAQEDVHMTIEKWKQLIDGNKKIHNIPVVINADFGHTMPMTTFPIGGKCKIYVKKGQIKIDIIDGSL